jgi:hypothetical protein
MKAVSLVFCIVLSISVILLLSMGSQATEFKEVNTEVNASSITEHIENGDDIYLENCRIVGELNTSKIKLETVPNSAYYELLNEGLDNKTLSKYGLSKNLRVIKNDIIFENSTFENGFNFSGVLFQGSTEFRGATTNSYSSFERATFNSVAEFREANFNSDVDFERVTFNNVAEFRGANFNSDANFDRATFNGDVHFWGATFNRDVNFWEVKFKSSNGSTSFGGATFNGSADFGRTTFNNVADFEVANFKCDANFDRATFNSDANFWVTTFNSVANFWGATFNDSAGFGEATFNGDVDFDRATYNSDVHFWKATFNSSANFNRAVFNSSVGFGEVTFNNNADFWSVAFNNVADFEGVTFYSGAGFGNATFNNDVHFIRATFNDSAIVILPVKSENIITDRKACDFFIRSYNNEARYTDADNIYYNYRKNAQDKKGLTSPSKWIDILSFITCGYGVRLSHTVGCIVGILVVFSFLYWRVLKFYQLSDASEKKPKVSHLEPILISIRGFTTMGSTDWYSKNDLFRILVAVEGLLGWIMLGIFMATLTNLLMEP